MTIVVVLQYSVKKESTFDSFCLVQIWELECLLYWSHLGSARSENSFSFSFYSTSRLIIMFQGSPDISHLAQDKAGKKN